MVDSGSTDNTVELAKSYGARVIHHSWVGFGPQKAFAVNQAKYDWVLCLDADEEISQELKDSIATVLSHHKHPKKHNPSTDYAYKMPRSNYFIHRFLRHGEGYPDLSLRLFDRRYANWSDDVVHEKVISSSPVGLLQGDLYHHSAESIHEYLSKQNQYTTLQAQQLFERGKRPSMSQMVLSPMIRFIKFYIFKQGYRDGWPGFLHISIGCMNSFLKYAKARALFDALPPKPQQLRD